MSVFYVMHTTSDFESVTVCLLLFVQFELKPMVKCFLQQRHQPVCSALQAFSPNGESGFCWLHYLHYSS